MDLGNETAAQLDWEKNRVATIAFSLVTAVGVGLVVLAVINDWGFLGIFWTGVLAVAGLAGLVGRALGGGFAMAPCPNCRHKLSFVHIRTERTQQCEGCGAWCTGTARMRVVADDHVATEPVFTFALPEGGIQWPRAKTGEPACTFCQAPSTRRVKIEASDAMGAAAAALAPVSVRRIRSIEFPACDAHDNGTGMDVAGTDITLRFSSYAYWKKIVAANAPAPAAV